MNQEIKTNLINYAANLVDSESIAKDLGINDTERLKYLLSEFKKEWDEAPCDPDGLSESQEITISNILFYYSVHISKLATEAVARLTEDQVQEANTFLQNLIMRLTPKKVLELVIDGPGSKCKSLYASLCAVAKDQVGDLTGYYSEIHGALFYDIVLQEVTSKYLIACYYE